MPAKPFPANILEQARAASQAWISIDPAFKVGNLALSDLEGEVDQLLSIQNQIASLQAQLTDLRNRRDATSLSIWDKIKRLRRGVQGIYGDDSSQYEMVGGTRLSERKPPKRKATPES